MTPFKRSLHLAVLAFIFPYGSAFADDDPFADIIISYTQGIGAASGYTDPQSVLGSPERFTGEGIFPSVVSAFSPAFGTDEILSIGSGGQVTVQFNTPITDDPNNPYGIDLLIFSNTGFIDADYPNGVVGGVFGNDGGAIEVSADGVNWFPIKGASADGPMPTIGYIDSGPYDTRPGAILTDFTRPVDPLLTRDACLGLNNPQLIEKYRGAGGGVGIDIAQTGLAAINFVRISNPIDAPDSIEIDGFSDVAPRIPGDVNYNGVVNVDDLLLLINAWGPAVPGGPAADFDNNGIINVDDLLTLIAHWST